MSEPVHVVGFAGSLRKRSYNRALLRAASELTPDGLTLDSVDLAPVPLFNAELEVDGPPPPVLRFREQLAAADAFLIASPEYNYSVTGVLKNAIDWASRAYPGAPSPLDGKAVAIMGAGGGMGTLRSQLHLREILLHNDMHPLNRPAVYVARAGNFFDDDLYLTDDDLRERLANMLIALRDWSRRLRA